MKYRCFETTEEGDIKGPSPWDSITNFKVVSPYGDNDRRSYRIFKSPEELYLFIKLVAKPSFREKNNTDKVIKSLGRDRAYDAYCKEWDDLLEKYDIQEWEARRKGEPRKNHR